MAKKAGRKPLVPPPDAAARIEKLSATGHSVVGIAKALRVGRDTFGRWMDEHPTLREAMERGREMERRELHNVLYRAATEQGNIIAAMFLLKARHGYREGDQGDFANKVQIIFGLPGAVPMNEYVVEGNSDKASPNQLVPAQGSVGP